MLDMNLAADDGSQVVQNLGKSDLRFLQMDFTALDAAHIQHIVDDGQQVIAGGEYLIQIIAQLFPVAHVGLCQGGKADHRIHGCADIVGHIGQERALGSARVLCRMCRLLQSEVDSLIIGSIGQIQNVLLLALYIAAERNHMEPAHLAGLLVNVLPVPFLLLSGEYTRKMIQHQICFASTHDLLDHMDILADFLFRKTQQLFGIGADIIHPVILRIHHQEHIVHIERKLGKQLVAGEELFVLALELQTVLLDDEQQQKHGQDDGYARYHEGCGGLELVHAGVDHVGGHNTQNRPVLEARGFVDQIVGPPADIKHQRAGIARQEILLQGVDPRFIEALALLQQREDIVNLLQLIAGIVHNDASIGQNRKGTRSSAECGNLQSLHQIAVVEGDGDGLVFEAAVAAPGRGNGKDHDLRLIRNNGIDHHGLLVEYQIRQLLPQIQIAPPALQRNVIAVAGDEEEIGEFVLLPGHVYICRHFLVAFNMFQMRYPHAHPAPVGGNQIIQRLVGLMKDFCQMGNTFRIYCFGNKAKIGIAQPTQSCNQHKTKQHG